MLYKFRTKIKSVKEEFRQFNWHKDQDGKSTCDRESIGWFVHLEGSYEALNFGRNKPDIKEGQMVEVSIRRMGD